MNPVGFIREVLLHDVRLDSGSVHWGALETNLKYLLMLDVDDLVWSFRKTADLPTPGKPYGGWEGSSVELRSHFVGHYLSATAQMWASTHNDTLKEKMTAVVSALSACQKKIDTGYLSAFPSKLFDRFEAVKPVWAPYYTIHMILAGLLDQYTFANNAQALDMTTSMVRYFYNRVQNVIRKNTVERHWTSLNEETGGMNDVLYRLFTITGDLKHLLLAHLFDKPCFLGLLAVQFHYIVCMLMIYRGSMRTHIPIVVGSQMCYATGGTSVGEFWSDPKRLASTLQTENEESCTTYNMLKRGTEPGVMIYMLPQGRGVSKAVSYHKWGTPFDSFWCCYGTGIESFSKLGDSIYFKDDGSIPSLYIIQYISSTLDWKSGKIVINQKVGSVVSSDPYLHVTLTSSSKNGLGQSSTLNLRIPIWTLSKGAKASLNAQNLDLPVPGSFLQLPEYARCLSLMFNMICEITVGFFSLHKISDDRPEYVSVRAILYGPYLLSVYSSCDWDIKTCSTGSVADWITPFPAAYNNHLVPFSQESGESTFILTNSNQSFRMDTFLKAGTNAAVHATLRLLFDDTSEEISTIEEAIGKTVMFDPFDFPGMVVVHQGPENNLAVMDPPKDNVTSSFRLVPGLDRNDNSVSLESISRKGCYVYSGVNYSSSVNVKLSCNSSSSEAGFNQAVSFAMNNGLSKYHPISFIAKGEMRNFLMAPLQSFRDESYSGYFNIQP
ncbi:skin secretory protein xP2-like isoform X1 [Hibiscus syriacus]|uniref:Skin secretory protein xP2-like isoform X1 n=1 Tax=Hibiscus syriacus TaxID=106335 RepID=A0A6A2Y6P2_HIBSY|nr:skin secretory protein xP2-like isoform X1 [Hibiscus syriacus]